MTRIVLFRSPPKKCYLAYSGGVDSSALLHLLLKKKVDTTLLWVNHNTQWCKTEYTFALMTADKYKIDLVIQNVSERNKNKSLECDWSEQRNSIFQKMDYPVLTAHHLDDAVEWYIMSSLQGQPKIINYNNCNVYRPMLTTKKDTINDYVNENKIEYISDPTNLDPRFNLRNKVRLRLIPSVMECFPGVYTTVKVCIHKKTAMQEKIIK